MQTLSVPAGVKFNGASIILRKSIGRAVSPYTGKMSGLDFGGRWWEMELTTVPLAPGPAAALDAWLDALDAPGVAASLQMPAQWAPAGSAAWALKPGVTVAGSYDSGALEINVTGLGPTETVLAGTFCTFAGRLHRVAETRTGGGILRITPGLGAEAYYGDLIAFDGISHTWALIERPARMHSSERSRIAAPVTLRFREVWE